MSNVILSPSRLAGEVTVPPSKSVSHRAILCAVLARGRSRIRNLAFSRDILATLNAARSLGVSVRRDENGCVIDSSGELPGRADIDCGESGSTLRFLIPVLGALGVDARLTGHGRLPGRPLGAFRSGSAGSWSRARTCCRAASAPSLSPGFCSRSRFSAATARSA
jgi:3-phosphoshikimate 1-carboxyvinyltransferase